MLSGYLSFFDDPLMMQWSSIKMNDLNDFSRLISCPPFPSLILCWSVLGNAPDLTSDPTDDFGIINFAPSVGIDLPLSSSYDKGSLSSNS